MSFFKVLPRVFFDRYPLEISTQTNSSKGKERVLELNYINEYTIPGVFKSNSHKYSIFIVFK